MSLYSLSFYNAIDDITEQYSEVIEHGTFIDAYDTSEGRIGLYHYHNYVVQVFYDVELNAIARLEAIDVFVAADGYVQIRSEELE